MENPPQTAIENRELPADVADAFRAALGLDDPPATLGDAVDEMARALAAADAPAGVDALCTAESSRHEARVGGEVRHFRCVLDALLLPFVLEDRADAEIRSRSPASDAVVEMTATPEAVSSAPGGAVVSFGLAADAAPLAERDDAVEYGYEAFCPYVNAFPDEQEYEEWAAATPAATTALSLPEAHALAALLADRLVA